MRCIILIDTMQFPDLAEKNTSCDEFPAYGTEFSSLKALAIRKFTPPNRKNSLKICSTVPRQENSIENRSMLYYINSMIYRTTS